MLSPSSWNGSSTIFNCFELNDGAVSQRLINETELEGVLLPRKPVNIEEQPQTLPVEELKVTAEAPRKACVCTQENKKRSSILIQMRIC